MHQNYDRVIFTNFVGRQIGTHKNAAQVQSYRWTYQLHTYLLPLFKQAQNLCTGRDYACLPFHYLSVFIVRVLSARRTFLFSFLFFTFVPKFIILWARCVVVMKEPHTAHTHTHASGIAQLVNNSSTEHLIAQNVNALADKFRKKKILASQLNAHFINSRAIDIA